jgi:hypothetical protein
MDEFTLDVIIDGHEEKILTYATSLYTIVETLIDIEAVSYLSKVVRTRDNKEWLLEKGNLIELREDIGIEDFTEE